MKDLIIIGAGGFGRELFSAAREAVGFGEQFRVKGYLDANPAALDRFAGYPPILGMALGVDTCCIVRSHRMTA